MSKGVYEARLEKDLASIRKRIRKMGKSVVAAVRDATQAVLDSDTDLATDIVLGDMPINRQARDLDERCHRFIARHLPSAGHLRFISSAMRLSKTLERIGDYAATIARAGLHFTKKPPEMLRQDIELLGGHATTVLQQCLDAYDKESVVEARANRSVVNRYGATFDKVYEDLLEVGRSGEYAIEDLFALHAIVHRLERVIHMGKNISEQTLFTLTGERKGEKTFDFLFVDRAGAGAALLAAQFCRKAYPEAGTFRCAGWDAAGEPNETFVQFADSKGIDLRVAVPVSFDDIRENFEDFDFVIDLEGGIREHIRRVPFHTTILSWPLTDSSDPSAVHKELVPRLNDLMEVLRGESEDDG
ncbi:Phosphate-specific transport system accessory protein PhoU [Planctomycetes bacterium Poly30]|uniref:Phosphate-specific transport system accessory protein PhoU n=1 Tax=Saltatorellus ferox TaxID=2528018 RepID=A0A518EKF5_9BACT|nr:Phosphate-specific transport system accessory protein PhoU [Planctomycetes bacterium Poly30]